MPPGHQLDTSRAHPLVEKFEDGGNEKASSSKTKQPNHKVGKEEEEEADNYEETLSILGQLGSNFDTTARSNESQGALKKIEQIDKILHHEEGYLLETLEKENGIGSAKNGLDATDEKELLALISQMFNQYKGDPQTNVRPIYAPAEVVNAAYKTYTEKDGPCKDKIREAVFSYPPKCMAVDLSSQPSKPQYVGKERKKEVELERRSNRPCIFTKVMCVDPKTLIQKPEHLVKWIENQFMKTEGVWFQNRIFATPTTIRKAWRLIYKNEPIDFERGGVCARLPNNVDTNMGSLQAKFPDPKGCFNSGKYLGGNCRVVNVECLTP